MPKFTNENSHTPLISTENLTPYGLNNETIRYYRSIDIVGESDICDMSEAHIVNCAGVDTFNEPFRTVRPFGRKDEYFIYVTKGEVIYRKNNGENVVLKPGMGIFLHSRHRQEIFSGARPVSFYWIHFTGYQALQTLEHFGFHHEHYFSAPLNEHVISLFQKVFKEFLTRKSKYIYASSLYLLQILIEIKRSQDDSVSKRKTLEKSLTYIHKNYLTDISIEQLAELENMSISHYRKIFIEHMNTPPKQYITSLRIYYAANLLQYSNKSIKEIAEQCGYNDIGYFYRVFKKTTNMTPVNCRNVQKINNKE